MPFYNPVKFYIFNSNPTHLLIQQKFESPYHKRLLQMYWEEMALSTQKRFHNWKLSADTSFSLSLKNNLSIMEPLLCTFLLQMMENLAMHIHTKTQRKAR